ncbi:MAG: sigma 54-interacting transcriptional regulator [Proteobacteria bacterium]|nr:sigma 54-interacting transcriptional regulator [Pseudomonadota bacterium]
MDLSFKILKNEGDLIKMDVEGIKVELKGIVAKSPKMLEAIAWSIVYSATADVICICGESGSGKEILFRVIRQVGNKDNTICVNCGAMTDSLLESELFGHKRGSFTDAVSDRKGAFIEAEDGFLFLDEIGEMSLKGQVKLLRAIEYREIKPVGADTSSFHNAKVVLATNKNLMDMIKENKFRRDLYYRIEGFTILIPPLRERPEDIEALIKFFAGDYKFAKGAIDEMFKHNWPGNVRELKNAIERAKIKSLYGEKIITWGMLGINKQLNYEVMPKMTLEDMEKTVIEDAYVRCDYNISTASKQLGIPRSTLYSKLKKFQLIA